MNLLTWLFDMTARLILRYILVSTSPLTVPAEPTITSQTRHTFTRSTQ